MLSRVVAPPQRPIDLLIVLLSNNSDRSGIPSVSSGPIFVWGCTFTWDLRNFCNSPLGFKKTNYKTKLSKNSDSLSSLWKSWLVTVLFWLSNMLVFKNNYMWLLFKRKMCNSHKFVIIYFEKLINKVYGFMGPNVWNISCLCMMSPLSILISFACSLSNDSILYILLSIIKAVSWCEIAN